MEKEKKKRGPVVSTHHALSERHAAIRCGLSYRTMIRNRENDIGPPYLQAGGKGKRVTYPLRQLEDWITDNLLGAKSKVEA
jgi:hypothetical protein